MATRDDWEDALKGRFACTWTTKTSEVPKIMVLAAEKGYRLLSMNTTHSHAFHYFLLFEKDEIESMN